ncbi:MAG: DUF5667 domain-containing protein [Pseudonocardiaceae bacterium]
MSDHTLERDLAVVAALRHAGTTARPRPDEVDRMRERVMAGFATVEADSPDTRVTPLRTQRGGRHARRPSVASEARGRVLVVAAAALCLLMSLSGMSLLLSRDALPGEALYAFKRSAESAELGLTFGEQSRALKHLEFATARVDEIEMMTAQADTNGSWSAGGPQFLSALDDFDADTAAGTRLLTTVATNGEAGILSSLIGWVEQQEQRLDTVRAAMPMEASTRLTSSLDLLERVRDRAAELDERSGCRNITSGVTDDLGPLPSEEACVRDALEGAASAHSLPGHDGTRASRPDGTGALLLPGALVSGQPGVPAPAGPLPQSPGAALPVPLEPGTPTIPGAGSPPPPLVLPLPLPDVPAPPVLPGLPAVEVE